MAVWTSKNGKWVVLEAKFGKYTSEALILEKKSGKKKNTLIEHVRVGDNLIFGGKAKVDSDSVFLGHDLPQYVMDKLMELRKEEYVR